MEPRTKLSPMASLQKATEIMKKTPSKSVLSHMIKEKKELIMEGIPKENAQKSLITVAYSEIKKQNIDQNAEESKGFISVKRTPWIDQTIISNLCLSPTSNIEGIRRAKNLPSEESQEEIKGNSKSIIMCGCGQPCNLKNENQCSDCLAKLQPGTQCGYLYEKADGKNLWRSYYKLLGTHLYSITTVLICRISYKNG